MSASSDLLKNAMPAGKTNSSSVGKTSASAALLKAAAVPAGGLKYVSQPETPALPPKESLGTKVLHGAEGFVKSLVSPVATIAARPFQAAAELGGASSEAVDAFSKKYSLGLVAPVPQNGADVKKDVGRAVETVAFGLPGAKLAETAVGGAAFGLGSSLEQGNDLFSKETLLSTGIGGATGALLHLAFKGAGKLLGKEAPKVAEEILPKVETGTPKVELPPEIKHANYAASQGYEPYQHPDTLPTIDMGKTKSSPLPTINAGDSAPLGKIPGYKYEPIKETGLPQYSETAMSNRNLPEPNRGSLRLPPISGNTVTKEARDLTTKLVTDGYSDLAPEVKASFNSITEKEQIANTTNFIASDAEAARQAAITGRGIPKEIHPQVLFNAVKNEALKNLDNGGAETLRDLAKSPIATQESLAGQTLRASQIGGNETDPVKLIAQNNKAIAEKIFKDTGKTVEQHQAEAVKELAPKLEAKLKPKLSKPNLEEFIKSITC